MDGFGAVNAVRRSYAYARGMGPGWVAGAIAAGPATIASLVTAGALFDYALLWVVVLSAAGGALAQYLAMRLGLLTGSGIVEVVETHLGDRWAWILVLDVVIAAGAAQLVIMNTVGAVFEITTGIDARIWGVVWAGILAIGLAGRGYRFIEFVAKLLVAGVVIAFVASVFVVPSDATAAVGGLVPTFPGGSALVAAGVLGGAVHITLITMHAYGTAARGWTEADYELASLDVLLSMVVAFGVYSVAIYLVAASVLSDPGLTAIGAAQALGPIVGPNAELLFLVGLGGAAVSTLGANTIVPPLLVADKLGWGTEVSDPRYRGALVVAALLSAPGAFIGGEVLGQLVLVLALGTVGTPFAIAIVLYLLNSPAVSRPTPTLLNVAGLALFAVSGTLAANFIREQVAAGVAPLSAAVLTFGVVLAIATAVLLGRFLIEEFRRSVSPTPS